MEIVVWGVIVWLIVVVGGWLYVLCVGDEWVVM